MTYTVQATVWETELQDMTLIPYAEGKEGLLAAACCTDGPSHGAAPKWTVAAVQPCTEIL